MTHNVPWQPFSGADSGPPAELDGAGIVVLVPAGDPAWPAWAALELARSVARAGRRVFLCDLGLSAPTLHSSAGVPRGEGVSDFILYGASPGHVADELEERLLFVSAGTPVATAEAVYASDRWDGFLNALSHAGACVMLMVPADAPGANRMYERADSLVVLGAREHVPVLDDLDLYRAIGLEPAPAAEAQPLVADVDGADQPLGSGNGGRLDEDDSGWELDPAAIGPDPDDEPVMTAERASAMNRAARLSPPRKNRLGLWFFLTFLLLVAIVVAGWYGLIDVPGISSRRTAGGAAAPAEVVREAAAQTGEEASGVPAEVPPASGASLDSATGAPSVDANASPLLAWGLRIGAFRNREVAKEQADLMSARAPGHLFVVVPVEVQGVRWFRVVSAAAEERADAEALRTDLATRLGAADAEQWLVRRAPLAFLAGSVATMEQAEARVETLEAAGVDAFALTLAAPDGTSTFRIYAGAYATADEAATMRGLLEAAGLGEAPLVERRGIRPE